MTKIKPLLANVNNPALFIFGDQNVVVKASHTIDYHVHVFVLSQALRFFTQVLGQVNTLGEMPQLDMSEDSVVNIECLLGANYNIEECIIFFAFQRQL